MKKSRIVLMVFGVLITVNAIIASVLSNIHLGILLTYVLGIILLVSGIAYPFVEKVVPKTVRYLFVACVALATLFVGIIFGYGKADNITYSEDVVIVLGAGIQGEELTENLRNRLDAAVDYYDENPETVIVVSGGQGPQETIAEALAMERYLLLQGIPGEQIIREEAATSTRENFWYSKQILDAYFDGSYRVAFITNDYHVYRAQMIDGEVGYSEISHCHGNTAWYLIIPSGLRECLAVMKQWILP